MKTRIKALGSRMEDYVVPALMGAQLALWTWAMSSGEHWWTKVLIGFFLGWSLVTTIRTLLLEQDIRQTEREIGRIDRETRRIRTETEMLQAMRRWQGVHDAGPGKSVPVQGLRSTGFLFDHEKN